MESFKIRNLTFSYPEQEKTVLKDLSFELRRGEFVTLCGPSGSGKSTLLRQLKTVLAPHGMLKGEIFFEGRPLTEIPQREQSAKIGFVMQNPDNQIVTDKVWHELAFGLESLGFDTPTIRGRVAEMASFFGIQNWFYKNVSELSGGQKQLLNLAAIMAMQPSVLILDEPTSQLDPIAAADFLATVGKINRELGTTVIMTEHRLEEVFPMSHRVLVMDEGRLICSGAPADVGRELKNQNHSMFLAMPSPMRIYADVPNDLACPVTVREGRNWLSEFAAVHELAAVPPLEIQDFSAQNPTVELREVWFRYEKAAPDIVKGLSLTAHAGEFLAILGGNGTGKTTTLSLIGGLNKPYRGKVLINGEEIGKKGDAVYEKNLGVLPQNPQALFVKKTVREDLYEMLRGRRLSKEEQTKKVAAVSELCHLKYLLDRHPYDLSGGEQQRAALAKILLLQPKILLLDEPTKGLDSEFKLEFAEILSDLLKGGVTVIMVSHDIEFCAAYAHRCAMFFDGGIVTADNPQNFFSGNSFYTTAANRMARHLLPSAVTPEDVIAACGGTPSRRPTDMSGKDGDKKDLLYYSLDEENSVYDKKPTKKKLPWWRKITACLFGAGALLTAVSTLYEFDLPFLPADSGFKGVYTALIISLLGLILSVGRRGDRPIADEQTAVGKRRLSKRTAAAALMILLAIPLTIFIGYYYFGDRKYYFISLLVILETLLPFVMVFESRKPQARELIVISVLCAIAVAGRMAFFMLPQFKPVLALVIIAGVAFGGEAGFLVGAVTGFVSNFFFGQGPWTPWQMFAFGIIGFLAGVLFKKGWLRRNPLSLCIFGGLAAIIIYGGIMNPASVLMYQTEITLPMIITAYGLGFPMDLVHGVATVFFLWFISRPMLEKLDRIKVKYGLLE
ncbi:MAG: ECF transporter S component [Bacillota bacterium]|jgi:energy-coupling factor transporter ATP-binding protein EcfA2/uncharacterized membrane protein